MAGLTPIWTRWDCRHQHRVSVVLQTRPHNTLPASVRCTVVKETWWCWTLQLATGCTACSVTSKTNPSIKRKKKKNHTPLWFIKYGCLWWLRGRVLHQSRYSYSCHLHWWDRFIMQEGRAPVKIDWSQWTICDELRERECYVVNEHVWGCICGHSKHGSEDIASTHDYAHCIFLSSHQLCTGGG